MTRADKGGATAVAGDVVLIASHHRPECLYTSLTALAVHSADERVSAATDCVWFEDTSRWQLRSECIDHFATVDSLRVRPGSYAAAHKRATVIIGTSCAFRRASVEAVGRFNPVYRSVLYESDLNIRLSKNQAFVATFAAVPVRHYRAEAPVVGGMGGLRTSMTSEPG